jgi:hypothetical protein
MLNDAQDFLQQRRLSNKKIVNYFHVSRYSEEIKITHPYDLSAKEDVVQEKYLIKEAIKWITDNPKAFVAKVLRNISEFWYFVETLKKQKLVKVYSLMLSICALISILSTFRDMDTDSKRKFLFLLNVVVYFNLVYSPIFAVFRYSLPVIPLLLIFVCLFIEKPFVATLELFRKLFIGKSIQKEIRKKSKWGNLFDRYGL